MIALLFVCFACLIIFFLLLGREAERTDRPCSKTAEKLDLPIFCRLGTLYGQRAVLCMYIIVLE